MKKDNQGGRAKRKGKAHPDQFSEQYARAMVTESRLLPIARAMADNLNKIPLAQEAGFPADAQRLSLLVTDQLRQITLAEPTNPVDAVVIASVVIRLANALPDINDAEGLRLASADVVYAVASLRRLHEIQAGISAGALGLDGNMPVLQ